MRSYSFPISFKGLGLRPSTRVSRLDLALTKARNVLSEEWGLEGFIGPSAHTGDYDGGIFFPVKVGDYLIYPNEIKRIRYTPLALDEVLPIFDPARSTAFDLDDPPTDKWHAAQQVNTIYATTGTHAIAFQDLTVIYLDDAFRYNTIAEHRGRILIGGILSDWPQHIKDLFLDDMTESAPIDIPIEEGDAGPGAIVGDDLIQLSKSSVLWSSPGSDDFPLWLHSSDEVTKEKFLEGLEKRYCSDGSRC